VSPGNVEFVQVVTSMVVAPATAATIVMLDERRLRGHALARAWTPASRDAAIFGTWLFGAMYGCVALLVHFTKTRWSFAGFGIGSLWVAFLLAVDVGSMFLAAAVIDWLGL
jgi:hypothetical protein